MKYLAVAVFLAALALAPLPFSGPRQEASSEAHAGAVAPEAGLAFWWGFDEGSGPRAHEPVGFHEGTLHGARYDEAVKGPGSTFSLKLSGGGVRCPRGRDALGEKGFTLSLWFRPDRTPRGTYLVGCGRAQAGDDTGACVLSFDDRTGAMLFETGDGTKADVLRTRKTRWRAGAWHHVAAVWDGTTNAGSKKVYLDGTLHAAKASAIGSLRRDTRELRAGHGNIGSFIGNLDEVRVYSRALDPGEVKRLHDAMEAPIVYGCGFNPTGDPIGGGPGYRRIVDRKHADYVARNTDEFLAALKTATAGQVLYIEDAAVINLTGKNRIPIPDGVTLASGRGMNGSRGALIVKDDQTLTESWKGLFTAGQGVRFTGLRLRGPEHESRTFHFGDPVGISLRDVSAEIDNCEIFGWTIGVHVLDTRAGDHPRNLHLHHCKVHHCMRPGLGYGVVLYGTARALYEACDFDWCRHSVAAGPSGTVYEARYNRCGPHGVLGNFDQHGDLDPNGTQAGEWVRCHHNTFERGMMTRYRGTAGVGQWWYRNRLVVPHRQLSSEFYPDVLEQSLYAFDNQNVAAVTRREQNPPVPHARWSRAVYRSSPRMERNTYSARKMACDPAGNVYVACHASQIRNWPETHTGFLRKYRADGTPGWETRKPIALGGQALALDGNGDVYFAGSGLVKFAHAGGKWLWRRPTHPLAFGTAVGQEGSVFCTGLLRDESRHSGEQCLTVKADREGKAQWKHLYRAPASEDPDYRPTVIGVDVAADDAGNAYVAGAIEDRGDYDVLLLKYAPDGTLLWDRRYDSGAGDIGYQVAIDRRSGHVYVAGEGYNGKDWDYLTVKFDADGQVVWSRRFDRGRWDHGRALAVDGSGHVYVTGYSENDRNADWCTIKYDPDGKLVWKEPLVFDGGDIDRAFDVAVDGLGGVYVSGDTVQGPFVNGLLVKYSARGPTGA